MLGGIFKSNLVLIALFLFVTLLWQAATADALPTMAINDNLAKSNDDVSPLSAINNQRGAHVVKRSLHLSAEQQSLFGDSRPPSRHRRLRKKMHSPKLKYSPDIFDSTGTNNKNLQAKRMKAAIDNRLKRFRMLDQDEFQEMLNSLSQQMPDEQPRILNSMDTIGGMQLENYWSRK